MGFRPERRFPRAEQAGRGDGLTDPTRTGRVRRRRGRKREVQPVGKNLGLRLRPRQSAPVDGAGTSMMRPSRSTGSGSAAGRCSAAYGHGRSARTTCGRKMRSAFPTAAAPDWKIDQTPVRPRHEVGGRRDGPRHVLAGHPLAGSERGGFFRGRRSRRAAERDTGTTAVACPPGGGVAPRARNRPRNKGRRGSGNIRPLRRCCDDVMRPPPTLSTIADPLTNELGRP